MSSTIKRLSAAVMFTDIAGYTDIMARDEEKALSLLQNKRKVLKPLIDKHDGVYVKGTGDGTLSYFDSAYKASKCAKLFQESIYDHNSMNVRVGIHVGDIVLDDGDVYGDGVNVASRLESMSPVGGICVSNTVYDELRNKKEFDGVELGLQSLKGVGRLVEIYGLKGDLLTEPKPSDYKDNKVVIHTDNEVPSIAIIPFDNKGADEDVFYAYGISADLIADCSSAGLIRVAGLKDIEKLDFTNLKYDELSQKLFVRYIAQGTLWKMDEVFQLTIELYDTKEKKVVWSDRWQEKWNNLPSIKSSLSDGLLKALDTKPKVEQKVETTNAEAYEFYLKAKFNINKRKKIEDILISRNLLEKAVEIDNTLILAKCDLGRTYLLLGDYQKGIDKYFQALQQAEESNDKYSMGYSLNAIGCCLVFTGDFEKGFEYLKRSKNIREELGDKLGIVWSMNNFGEVKVLQGEYKIALEYLEKGIELMKEIDTRCWQTILETTTFQLIAKKRLSIDFDVQELHSVIKDNKPFEPEHFYNIYLILEDNNYLKTAYDRIKLIASELRLENREKYLTFYYPKAIVEEWEKVK
jgi:class 3 adenylate cyclase/TolB-like protein